VSETFARAAGVGGGSVNVPFLRPIAVCRFHQCRETYWSGPPRLPPGTEFLSSETGAPKPAQETSYAQRRKSRPHDREKPAENRPFRHCHSGELGAIVGNDVVSYAPPREVTVIKARMGPHFDYDVIPNS
jgi:hypothetical protein